MASTIRFGGSNKEDIFAKIKGLIKDMITKTEAEADATEKVFCDKQLSETNAKKDDKTGEIEKLTAKIEANSAELSGLAGSQKALKVLNDYTVKNVRVYFADAPQDDYSKNSAHCSAGGYTHHWHHRTLGGLRV
jgi:vacuolar-type H+-ATPase subunit I/STV1